MGTQSTIILGVVLPVISIAFIIFGILATRNVRKRRLAAAAAHNTNPLDNIPYLQRKDELEDAKRGIHEIETQERVQEVEGAGMAHEMPIS